MSKNSAKSAPIATEILIVLPHHVVRAEVGDLGGADLAHADVDLAAEDAERGPRPLHAARRYAVERRPALEDELGAHAERDDGIEAAADAAVEHHCHLV